jgi:hypothetical protein
MKQAENQDPEHTKVPEALRYLVQKIKQKARPGRSD